MKTDKEYPATHSMSTAWYAIDDAGEVAIIDFDENGPVPQMAPQDESPFSVLLDHMSTMVNGIKSANFSDTQADCIIDSLEDITDDVNFEELRWTLIFTIPPQKTQRLLQILSEKENLEEDWNGSWNDGLELIALSISKGLWCADMYMFGLDGVRKLLKEKLLLKYRKADLSDVREWETCKFSHDWDAMPVYLYKQSYWSYEYPEKCIHKPEYPLTEDQLTEKNAGNALRIPGRFSDMDEMQIGLYAPFSSHYTERLDGNAVSKLPLPNHEGKLLIREQTIPEIVCGKTCQLCHWKEMFPLYDFEKSFSPIGRQESIQCSDMPTLLWIGRIGKHIYLPSEPFWRIISKSGWMLRQSCFVPLLYGVLNNPPKNQKHEANELIFDNCKINLAAVVDFLKPHAIIAYDECLPLITRHFDTSDGVVNVNGREYPLLSVETMIRENGKSLERFRNEPYRGTIVNRVVSDILPEEDED